MRWWGGTSGAGSFLGLTLLALLSCDPAHAAQVHESDGVRVEVGLSGWITEGETKWSHDASPADPRLGNPTSKLVYKDVGTNVIDFSGRVTFNQQWFIRANYGFADIGGGRLTDDDFTSVGGQRVFSKTHSNIAGDDLWYVGGDLGARVLSFPGQRGWVELFIGYQYWREKHRGTGVTQVECSPSGIPGISCNQAGTVTNQGQNAITNTATWNSIRLGAQSELRLTRRFSIEGKAAFIPYTSLSNEDIHHLRSDLRQNPSFSMSGTGIGANLEATVKFQILKGLFANVGYRYWWMRVTDGMWKNFPVGGGSETFNLNEFQSVRQGLIFGLSYEF